MTGLSQLPICSSKSDKDIYIQVVKQCYDINSILRLVWDMIKYLERITEILMITLLYILFLFKEYNKGIELSLCIT